ncbi:MAG: hypothetical protein DCC71_03075 [Proteobacteria bacterium]|nr:MAG: hypothetical protein DCC71_03075 [Pseudomonadota bacterium]
MIGRLLPIYFLSGLGAVAAEAVWMRWLRELLGATAPAASATLVAFFAGHAAGAAWMARRSARGADANPLVTYGRLEIAAAVGAMAVPALLWLGEQALGLVYDSVQGAPGALALVRFAIALGATFPAAFCFGATFPAIASAAVGATRELGARGGALYAVNTLGAALGTALAVFWLPGLVGVHVTYSISTSALLLAALGAFVLARRQPTAPAALGAQTEVGAPARPSRAERRRAKQPARHRTASPPRAHRHPATRELRPRTLLLLAALSGFGAFALQVLLVQSFAQVSNQSIHAFGAVLVAVLLAIAAGGAAVAAHERRPLLDPRTLLGIALVAAALATAVFPFWLERRTNGFEYVGGAGGGFAYFGALLGTVLASAGPALLAVALVFPATFAAAGRRDGAGRAGHVLGRLVVANTAGAIAGALAAPYLLLPIAGLWPAFAALSLLYGIGAVFVPEVSLRWRVRRDLVLVMGWMAVWLRASPLAVPPVALAEGEELIAAAATPAAVVAVVAKDGERLIRIDSHYALGGTAERVHHERQSHLPLVLAPHARRVAYVGSATGISAGGALAHPIESLHLVELVPGVADAARTFFRDANRGVYEDPRTHVVVDDARNFLRWTGARFDVVVADLFVPWQAGAGSLYTREHFQAVREHLLENGLFCQWLPLYQLAQPELESIVATFQEVFPRSAVFRGDFYGRFPIAALVGWPGEVATPDAIAAATVRLAAAGVADRWVADPAGPWALYAGPLMPLVRELADVPRNTDARPLVERLAASTHAGGSRGKLDPVVGLRWIAFTDRLRAAARATGDPLWRTRGIDERRAIDGGAALQAAGAHYAAGDTDAAARAFALAADLLPARLVADAAEDPTAAELWSAE